MKQHTDYELGARPVESEMELDQEWEEIIARRDAVYQAITAGYQSRCMLKDGTWIQKDGQPDYYCIRENASDKESETEWSDKSDDGYDTEPIDPQAQPEPAELEHPFDAIQHKNWNADKDNEDAARRDVVLSPQERELLREGRCLGTIDDDSLPETPLQREYTDHDAVAKSGDRKSGVEVLPKADDGEEVVRYKGGFGEGWINVNGYGDFGYGRWDS